jgi:hypothetical protein
MPSRDLECMPFFSKIKLLYNNVYLVNFGKDKVRGFSGCSSLPLFSALLSHNPSTIVSLIPIWLVSKHEALEGFSVRWYNQKNQAQ